MACGAVLARHIPTAPTPLELRSNVQHGRTRIKYGRTRRLREDGASKHAGDIASEIRSVTRQAIHIAAESLNGGAAFHRIDRVKDRAELRIHRSYFHQSTGYPPDIAI